MKEDEPGRLVLLRSLAAHAEEVRGLRALPDGRGVSWSSDGLIVWEPESGTIVRSAECPGGMSVPAARGDRWWTITHASPYGLTVQDSETGVQRHLGGEIRPQTLVVSRDGRRMVGGASDWGNDYLVVWDLETGAVLHAPDTEPVAEVRISPDGRWGIFSFLNAPEEIWDLDSGTKVRTLGAADGRLLAIEEGADDPWVVSGDEDMAVWELKSGVQALLLRGHTDLVNAAVVTAGRARIVSASCDGTVRVWSADDERVIATFYAEAKLCVCAVMRDGRTILAGDSRGAVHFLRLEAGAARLRIVPGGRRQLRERLLNFDWLYAKLASEDPAALIAEFRFFRDDPALRPVPAAIRAAADILARDGTQLAGQLLARLPEAPGIQELLEGAKRWRGAPWLRPLAASMAPASRPESKVTALALTPDGWVIAGFYEGALKKWRLESETERVTFRGHQSGSAAAAGAEQVTALAVAPDGRRAVSGSADHTLKIWDLRFGTEVRTLKGHTNWVTAVAVTPDGKWVISGSRDQVLKLWDLESGAEVCTLQGWRSRRSRPGPLQDSIAALAVTADGRWLVAGASDNTIRVWDLHRRSEVRTLKGHTGAVAAVAVSADGKRVISASWDRTIRIWELEGGVGRRGGKVAVRTLEGHREGVCAVPVTSDGSTIFSASWDRSVRVWDAESGKTLATFCADAEFGHACCLAADERTLVAGDNSGRVHVLRWE